MASIAATSVDTQDNEHYESIRRLLARLTSLLVTILRPRCWMIFGIPDAVIPTHPQLSQHGGLISRSRLPTVSCFDSLELKLVLLDLKMGKGSKTNPIVNMRQRLLPNFRDEQGRLFLVRCYACDSERGRENYLMAVASGACAWCGWKDKENE